MSTPLSAGLTAGLRAELLQWRLDGCANSVAAEAEAILLSVVHTDHQHDTYVDVATGTYDMDCSDYVGYILQRIAPLHY